MASLLTQDNTTNKIFPNSGMQVINETMRCRKIIRGLLDFARQTESEKKLTDINKIVKDTLLLIEHQASMKNVKILTELNEQLPMIIVDSNQIQEVFILTLVNDTSFALMVEVERAACSFLLFTCVLNGQAARSTTLTAKLV